MKTARLLAIFLTTTCLLGTASMNVASGGDTPSLKPQEKGFYRVTVGDFAVIALADGTNKREVEQQLQMLYGDKEKIKDLLTQAYPDGQMTSSANAFLINTGVNLVLVDAGNGSLGSPTMGNLIGNLRAAGYQPESIDEIYLTHMHVDHIGGLVAGAERVFPNATVYANKAEADHWLSDSNLNAAPAYARRSYQLAQTALTPYINAGKFKTFEGSTQLIPGIRAESLFGHTPGHTAYFVESKGETLVLWGDIVHVTAVQFAEPGVTISYDSDREEAAKARHHIFAEASKNGWLIGGAHLAFPGFGHLRANGDGGYIFSPIK